MSDLGEPTISLEYGTGKVAEPPSRYAARWWPVMLGVILLFAAVMRFGGITHESFWIDELYSTEFSTGHCYVDLRTPRNVIHPHLHLTDMGHALPVWRMWTTFGDDSH